MNLKFWKRKENNKSDMDMKSLEKLGTVQEMDIDYLFNYKELDVKQ